MAAALATLKAPPEPASLSKDEEVVRSRVLSNKSLALEIQKTLDKLHGKTKATVEEPEDAGYEDVSMGDAGDDQEGQVEIKATDEADESDLEDQEESNGTRDDAIFDDADADDLASNAGWESGSVDDTGHVGNYSDDEASDSDAESGTDGSSMQEDEEEGGTDDDSDDAGPSSHKQKASTKVPGNDGSSMFLPSLAVGFARGDDSDWSDGEAKVADGVRKNRRGQRARQAYVFHSLSIFFSGSYLNQPRIWEKKYGRGAKHVVQRQQQETISNAYATRGAGRGGPAGRGSGRGAPRGGGRGGSFSVRGAGGPDRSRGRGGAHGGRGAPSFSRGGASTTRPSQGQGSNSIPVARTAPPKPKVDDKPVHPSWEAKQKQKTAAAIVPSQGKKIVF